MVFKLLESQIETLSFTTDAGMEGNTSCSSSNEQAWGQFKHIKPAQDLTKIFWNEVKMDS